MTEIYGHLWVNPFLDEFYEWGKGEWWNNKKEFLNFLDEPQKEIAGGMVNDEYPQEIVKYLVERVPEWYFDGLSKDSSGVPLVKIKHLTIHGFSTSGGEDIPNFLSAWENNTPFTYFANFYPEGSQWKRDDRVWEESYKDYPAELKKEGGMLLCHAYYKTYVRLVDVQGVWWNALLFTAQKNKSWCKSSKISFLNWTLTNPMEVKE